MKFSDTHLEMACQKFTISAIGVKKLLRPQIQSLKKRQSLVKVFIFFLLLLFFCLLLIISFPNQVMNTDIFCESIYNKKKS